MVLCAVLVGCDALPRHPENGIYEIDVLALGDSFTAGNGARESGQQNHGYYGISGDDPRPDDQVRNVDWSIIHPYGCFRNVNNYSFELYDLLGSTGAYVNGACTGDITDNLRDEGPPDPQFAGFSAAARAEFDLITLTIGGNDLDFGSIMDQCFVEFRNSAVDCQNLMYSALDQLHAYPNGVYRKMREALVRVAEEFPGARIVLVGYPLLFEDEDYTLTAGDVEIQPGAVLENGLDLLNAQQQMLVDELNPDYDRRFAFLPVHKTDGSGIYDGHGLRGSADDWINPPGDSPDDLPYLEEWFHPTAAGHAAIADGLTELRIVQQLAGGLELQSAATDTVPTLTTDGWTTPSISSDGRYVAFMTEADLVEDDTNGVRDAYVHDSDTRRTERVSVATDGTQANGYPGRSRAGLEATISADGRYVAFISDADNLVPGDDNATDDVFVRDRQDGTTERVSVATNGTESNDASWGVPALSDDGRYVAFWSHASNLVAGDTNACSLSPHCLDVFVHDQATGTTVRASVASDGTQANVNSVISPRLTLSADGRYVAFSTNADTLVPGDANECIPVGLDPELFPGCSDVFVHDLETSHTERVSVTSDGAEADSWSTNPSISSDGRYVAFASTSSNLAPGSSNPDRTYNQVFLYDRVTGETALVSPPTTGFSGDTGEWPTISPDGRYVAFEATLALGLGAGPGTDCESCTDIFVRDLETGTLLRGTDTYTQFQPELTPAISEDASYIAFSTPLDNLVPSDLNNAPDVFVQSRTPVIIGSP